MANPIQKLIKGAVKGALPAKRMSKAEAEAMGLYHEIGGGLKLQKPVEEIKVKVKEDPTVKMAERRVISPESMQGGVAFPLVGDRAAAGKILEELEGVPMEVRLEGGPEFMRANPGMAWASGKGVLSGLSKQVRRGAESGGDVYGVYTAMSPQSVDFNTMVTEALLNQLDLGALRKKDIKEFNRAVRAVKGQGGKPKAADFPGIDNPDIRSILMEGPGGQRDAFVKAMGKAQFQNVGFPDVVAARVGVTDPALLDIPRGSTGFTIAKMDPEGRVLEESGHATYPFDLAGEYVGGFEQQIPHDIMFYDPIQAKRMLGSTPTGAHKSLELNAPLQYLDQEWLDRVMQYLERQKKLDEGYAKGGMVKKAKATIEDLLKYVDPESKYLGDWPWRQMPEVAEEVGERRVPDYIQKVYGQFMADQAKRAQKGELTPRDLVKAYTITRSSVNRGGLGHSTATKAGLKLPKEEGLVRPEGAFAEWLGSKEGQRFLDAAERGEADPAAIADIEAKFSPFGMPSVLAQDMRWAAENAPMLGDISAAVTGPYGEFREFVQQMPGIGPAKSGFMASMLGRGDQPTFDARQIRMHTGAGGSGASKYMKRGRGEGGEEAIDRLAARQSALQMELDPSLEDMYQHLVHHTVWDRYGGDKTTHEDLVRALRGYAEGGSVKKEKV